MKVLFDAQAFRPFLRALPTTRAGLEWTNPTRTFRNQLPGMHLNRPSSLVIFLAILMLCGQVVATPLLICRNMFTVNGHELPQSAGSLEHCAGMMMEVTDNAAEERDLASDAGGLGFDTRETLSELMQDCDYLCQFYRGIPSLDVADSMFILSSLLLRDGDGYLNRFVTPPIEVHFRPPINA